MNPEISGHQSEPFPARWNAVIDRRFDGASLMEVLADYASQLREGTLISELAKVVERERRMNLPMAILLEQMSEVRQTVRVDGIMPFRIPLPSNISEPVRKLLEEVRVMNYDVPDSREELARLCDEISICILACLHRREVQIDHRLVMRMQLECPYSPNVGRKKSLMLMGYLPFGGRVTLFYSSLLASDWLRIDPGSVEFEESLGVVRQDDDLRIVATASGRPSPGIDRFKVF